MVTIASDTRLVRNEDIVQASLGENSIALMSLERANYYGLEEPASTIWELLGEERSFDELVSLLTQKFDVEQATCAEDTRAFVLNLLENGLVRVVTPRPNEA